MISFIDATEGFLALLASPPVPERVRIEALAKALDALASSYHSITAISFAGEGDPPQRATYEDMRSAALRAFPSFGMYAVVPPEPIPSAPEFLVGDAIDDVADIARDLADVRWRFHNTSPDDAAWDFKFGYESNWGRHLHDLRSYVHWQLFVR